MHWFHTDKQIPNAQLLSYEWGRLVLIQADTTLPRHLQRKRLRW
jgi:hypothetical protein